MRPINRRTAIRQAAAVSLTSALAATGASGQTLKTTVDALLIQARKCPNFLMFGESATFQTSTTEPNTFALVFTSAVDENGKREMIEVRPGTMTIFRADARVNEETKKGGVLWKCGAKSGTVTFKQPGQIILAVREHDGTVRCHTLVHDFRC